MSERSRDRLLTKVLIAMADGDRSKETLHGLRNIAFNLMDNYRSLTFPAVLFQLSKIHEGIVYEDE